MLWLKRVFYVVLVLGLVSSGLALAYANELEKRLEVTLQLVHCRAFEARR